MRNKTMEEIIEVIMDCRDDDSQPPINIQIDIDQQKNLKGIICAPNILNKLQAKEQAEQDIVDAALDTPCLEKLKLSCTDSLLDLRPPLFPEDLWPFVEDSQKPLIAQRMSLFQQDMIVPAIFNLRKKININKMRSHCYKYYEAQAIANLDCYLVIDENNPPMVSDNFMFHIDLKEGAVVEKYKPQMFTEVQKRF
jgi:hypothetical protein